MKNDTFIALLSKVVITPPIERVEAEVNVLIGVFLKVVDHLEKKVAESDEVDSKVYAEIDLDWVKSMITTLIEEPDFFRVVNFLSIFEKYDKIFSKREKKTIIKALEALVD